MAAMTKLPATVGLNIAFTQQSQGVVFFGNEAAIHSANIYLHNGYLPWQSNSQDRKSTPIDDTTKNFIKLEQSFLHQLDKFEATFEGQPRYLLQEKMKVSSEFLLCCSPDVISLQLTEEGSIFYTVKKNGIHIYFQHYLIDEFDDADEAIVSVYNGEEKLLDYGGTLIETVTELNTILASKRIFLPELA